MNNEQQISALQDLIIRLQDAEKGYLEIKKATQERDVMSNMQRRADERHKMHRKLETHVRALGSSAEVKSSVLGDMHRAFIDVKINHFADSYEGISAEIQRGANVLIDDYNKVFEDVILDRDVRDTLVRQQNLIKSEIEELPKLQEMFAQEVVA